MDDYTFTENLIIMLGFASVFVGVLAIGAHIAEEWWPRNSRKFDRIKRWFK